MYEPEKEQSGAPLNFHLTGSEKKEVERSLRRAKNISAFSQTMSIINNSGGVN